MKQIFLKPAPGRACPMPEKGGALLPVAGEPVTLNAWWQRRLNDGDAVIVKDVVPEPVPALVVESKQVKGAKA
ncbi:DUF2635 domain-containing protein [Pseudomonas proteolytica]|uniref:DUF2635 domain-containing protein n=1 Tax=Pseudomonas proteolytica TaxID=219574 RepID=UPI001472FFC1|nr:DUF2635 domain-containing protein [Pseudomonas proteolytica]NMZ37106.1 DUF2635 domain-containing protein [Pseudomonas proteolytica]